MDWVGDREGVWGPDSAEAWMMRSHQRKDLGENINGEGQGQRHWGGKKPAVFNEQTRRRPAGMEPASEEDGTLMHQDKREPDYV